ncbi:unnamed protein product [Paramecium pentaurelia]|uniref:Uncharacterized protein n=1 Tax=Paramecium pentaurelia TaxID=43138 RepID=A0A8S1SMU9_9CILI|nr:unnamed protein product [Paramecium pentaurelia]
MIGQQILCYVKNINDKVWGHQQYHIQKVANKSSYSFEPIYCFNYFIKYSYQQNDQRVDDYENTNQKNLSIQKITFKNCQSQLQIELREYFQNSITKFNILVFIIKQ